LLCIDLSLSVPAPIDGSHYIPFSISLSGQLSFTVALALAFPIDSGKTIAKGGIHGR
jgi:hypothetical protein